MISPNEGPYNNAFFIFFFFFGGGGVGGQQLYSEYDNRVYTLKVTHLGGVAGNGLCLFFVTFPFSFSLCHFL